MESIEWGRLGLIRSKRPSLDGIVVVLLIVVINAGDITISSWDIVRSSSGRFVIDPTQARIGLAAALMAVAASFFEGLRFYYAVASVSVILPFFVRNTYYSQYAASLSAPQSTYDAEFWIMRSMLLFCVALGIARVLAKYHESQMKPRE